MYKERDTCPAKDWYDKLDGCKKCLDWCYEAKMYAPCEIDYDPDGDYIADEATDYEGETSPTNNGETKLPF